MYAHYVHGYNISIWLSLMCVPFCLRKRVTVLMTVMLPALILMMESPRCMDVFMEIWMMKYMKYMIQSLWYCSFKKCSKQTSIIKYHCTVIIALRPIVISFRCEVNVSMVYRNSLSPCFQKIFLYSQTSANRHHRWTPHLSGHLLWSQPHTNNTDRLFKRSLT